MSYQYFLFLQKAIVLQCKRAYFEWQNRHFVLINSQHFHKKIPTISVTIHLKRLIIGILYYFHLLIISNILQIVLW